MNAALKMAAISASLFHMHANKTTNRQRSVHHFSKEFTIALLTCYARILALC